MTEKNSRIIMDFMKYIKTTDTKNFIKGMFYCFCAPTIKGIKAASLINFRRKNGENIRSIWEANADKWLEPLGLEWILLDEHYGKDNALVLVYRRELLEKILCRDKACCILKSQGYPLSNNVDDCLECLRKKFCRGFPHEIGLFLDYPPDDVMGFIEDRTAKNLSCPGYWKVYGNAEEAQRIFNEYRKAECEAALLIMAGRTANIKSEVQTKWQKF